MKRSSTRLNANFHKPKDPTISSAMVLVDIKVNHHTSESMQTIRERLLRFPQYSDIRLSSLSYRPHGLRSTRTLFTVNRSPHGNKKARDQFHLVRYGSIFRNLQRTSPASTTPSSLLRLSTHTPDPRLLPRHALFQAAKWTPIAQKGARLKLNRKGGYRY